MSAGAWAAAGRRLAPVCGAGAGSWGALAAGMWRRLIGGGLMHVLGAYECVLPVTCPPPAGLHSHCTTALCCRYGPEAGAAAAESVPVAQDMLQAVSVQPWLGAPWRLHHLRAAFWTIGYDWLHMRVCGAPIGYDWLHMRVCGAPRAANIC